jgi:predicted nuclease of restriction endonuclease-like (RecB) superfamily
MSLKNRSLAKNNLNHLVPKNIDTLFVRATTYIDKARYNIKRSVDSEMTLTYWMIGHDIVEEEQHGKERAEYGKALLKGLSEKLQKKYKAGFSVDVLEKARKFFIIYQNDVVDSKSATVSRKSTQPDFITNLSWSHYVELMKIARDEARQFYTIEATKNNWNVRELRRQINSFLFDRLTKSKDKQTILKLAYQGQEINTPEDAIKDPFVLEFVGLPESHRLIESKLEEALINNLQHFLLELGKGFAFVARQKRLTLEGDHFYADLVFYHTILKCYVLVDIKTRALTHADLGQMQLYVNYFDAEVKSKDDNPTIGLVLCTDKNEAMVKYTLGTKTKQIFTSKYQFHLPTEAELEAELKREVKLLTKSQN